MCCPSAGTAPIWEEEGSTSDLISSPLVEGVASRYPGIRMRISMGYAGDLQGWLETGEIDVALLYGVEREPQLRTIVAETNAMGIQKSRVLGGHGLTILPPIAFARELASGQVTAAPLKDPRVTRTIAVALSSNRSVGQHVQRTAEILVECVRQAVQKHAWPEAHWIAKP